MTTAKDISQYDRAFLAKLLGDMLLIRRFEEKCAQLYGLKKIRGFCHLYIGQEAVAVGAIAAAELPRDYVFTAYRDHGHALACGMMPETILAELFGKAAGCSGGKGGSMHLFDVDRHMYGGNAIVGAHIPLAAGAGLAINTLDRDGVVLCFFGDGAIHQGSFHETLNLAKIWNLPVVFICENNQYGMGTFYKRVSSVEDLSALGASYGIPGRQVDGMDVLAVYDEVGRAVAQARRAGLATLLEIKTYRYRGHSMSDPAKYRSKDELQAYRDQDPLLIFGSLLKAHGLLGDEDIQRMDAERKQAVAEAVRRAEGADPPAPESLYEDVFAPASEGE